VRNVLEQVDEAEAERVSKCHPLCSCDLCEKGGGDEDSPHRAHVTVFSRDDRGYTGMLDFSNSQALSNICIHVAKNIFIINGSVTVLLLLTLAYKCTKMLNLIGKYFERMHTLKIQCLL